MLGVHLFALSQAATILQPPLIGWESRCANLDLSLKYSNSLKINNLFLKNIKKTWVWRGTGWMVYYVFKLSPITHHTAILYTRSGVSFEVLKFRLEAERHPSRRLDARSPWLLNTLQGQEGQDGEEKIKSVVKSLPQARTRISRRCRLVVRTWV